MSITRQSTDRNDGNPDLARAPVVGRVESWSPSNQPPHSHKRHQLICAVTGVIHVVTSLGEWVLPSSRALWISSGTEHSITLKRATETRVLYIDPDAYTLPGDSGCLSVALTPLMREVVASCARFRWDYAEDSPESRLASVLIDQLQVVNHVPIDLPFPSDPRALRIAHILRNEQSNRQTLAELAGRAASSPRTIERLFRKEAGMSFGNWRQQQRLLSAMEQLAYGESVTNVALEIGYESASSFIAAFRQVFGTTPARYFQSS